MVGVGKPFVQLGDDKSRAAHEKIVSDLGYRLRLPVLPVLLWDRAGEPEPCACVVAWAFQPVWPLAQGVATLTPDEKAAIAPAMSAMIPFDYWVGDTDRKGDHVVITSPHGGKPAAIGCIDYSNSLSFAWDAHDHASTGSAWHRNGWGLNLPLDHEAFEQSLELIENFDVNQIEDIVGYIPTDYLPAVRRDLVVQNLVSRRSRLRGMIQL